MSEFLKKLKIFSTAFIITVILAAFLLSLYWVELVAAQKGFGGLENRTSVERIDDLHYRLLIGESEREIDLTAIDRAAGCFQKYERWIVPQEIRAASRISVFAVRQFKSSRREQRELEFYKNAGLV